jgi:serine protease AprX
MAGPHVAGLVALVISANPGLAGQVAKIEDIIQKTAVKLNSSNCGSTSGVYPNNTFGNGRIDALAAVKEAIKILNVDNNSKTLTSVIAYPNPFSEHVNFEFKNCKSGTTLEVYAITGEKVIAKTWEAIPTNYELDLSTYASGAYFYKLTNGADCVNGKLFKVAQ